MSRVFELSGRILWWVSRATWAIPWAARPVELILAMTVDAEQVRRHVERDGGGSGVSDVAV